MSLVSTICEQFDVDIMRDIEAQEDDEGNILVKKEAYALGSNPELAAGLRGFQMTPWFDSVENLEEFLYKHRVRLQEIAQHQADTGDYECVNMNSWSK